ncbi:ABC transporter permease [Plastorhodobacter daqingensis]|uniref:ABC transporter permease n=1 Tax=Plastorhodobacter daqingensis TaxID=1387281 RepID=A0ABW2UQJ2_9RHOB
MSAAVAFRLARRELRGGLAGFRIFLACLVLGVAAIAAVGTIRASLEAGLREQGAVLLGGDAALSFTYRFATDAERAWMQDQAERVSEIVDFRSMATVGEGLGADRALTQVKAVDDAYPLVGEVRLDPPMPMAAALDGGDLPGGVMDRLLADRLAIAPGDVFRLGVQEFRLTAILVGEPDSSAGGFTFGPRTIVATEALAGSELLGPGTLFDTRYRLDLPEGANLGALRAEALRAFRDSGLRWQDRRNGAPGVDRFVDRVGAFLVLMGLAGLAVGGVGVSSAVRAYLERKVPVIGTLKTLGATGGMIFFIYALQIGALTLLGVALGLVLGAGVPLALAPVIEARLPIPATFALYPAPLAEAALYGVLTAAVFTLWPLAATRELRAAALFRGTDQGARRWPGPIWIAATALLLSALVGSAVWFSGVARLALGAAGGVLAALGVLALAALALRLGMRRLARSSVLRGHTALRLAVGAIGGPRSEAGSVILSLGLGLAVLAAVGQIESNLRGAIEGDLPERAPSYFFVDIQGDQLPGFLARLEDDPGVSQVETAPMLRGIVTRINGRPAREVGGDHWVLRGDRGVTYSAARPDDVELTEGEWWPEDYDGPPVMSFAAEAGAEMGLRLGDEVTVNILGRDITAAITSFRNVDFSTGGIGFVLSMNPSALAGAPHTHIATVYAEEMAEAAILRDLATAYPNITAIRVRDVIGQVSEALSAIATATAYAAGATLLTGFIVLIGAAAAGERGRLFEAAVLRTVGASRATILASFALRAALMGAAAGAVAIAAGAAAAWAVMRFVMEVPFRFEPMTALAIVAGGVVATLFASLLFALRPLAARPAQVLRQQE